MPDFIGSPIPLSGETGGTRPQSFVSASGKDANCRLGRLQRLPSTASVAETAFTGHQTDRQGLPRTLLAARRLAQLIEIVEEMGIGL